LKKGIILFLLLSLAVSASILVFSVDASSFDVFKRADGKKILLAFALVVCLWGLDASKMKLLVRASGGKITFRQALELTWINYFGSAITPMQSGGGPFQMYVMYQDGISVGQTVAITLIRTILIMLILGATAPFAFILEGGRLPHMGAGAKWFIFYVVVFISLVWVALIISIAKPVLIKRLAVKIIHLLRGAGAIKEKWEKRLVRLAVREIDAYNENIRAFLTTGRAPFMAACVIAFVQIVCQLSVMPCMIWALGVSVSYTQCVLAQALFLFLLYFIPTPGGSGAAEGGAALVFSMFVTMNVAGILGVGWRIITEYTGIVLGAVVALRRIGWRLANQIMAADNDGKKDRDEKSG
jgi:uncharacterized protein (TIRG00374 family)